MRLIGRYASPYVRRVAVTMRHYGLPYEHLATMPFGPDKETLATYNPIGRVPVLELDNDERLIDSAAILDYLDNLVGPDKTLTPARGKARRRVLSHLAVATGAMDKLVAVLYERHFRPKDFWHRPWIDACDKQVRDGFAWLDDQFEGDWIGGGGMTQADVSIAVFWAFGHGKRPGFFSGFDCPRIAALSERLEATPNFQATTPEPQTLSADLSA